MRHVFTVSSVILILAYVSFINYNRGITERVPINLTEKIETNYIAPMPREVFLPNWTKLHKDAKNGKNIGGAITLGFPEGGFADIYLVDGKEVRVLTIGSYLSKEQTNYAIDYTSALKEFDKVTSNMRVVVRGTNIVGKTPENPKINVYGFELD